MHWESGAPKIRKEVFFKMSIMIFLDIYFSFYYNFVISSVFTYQDEMDVSMRLI